MRKLLVGLGNPGKDYALTKHNAGFLFLDHVALLHNLSWSFDSKLNSETTKLDDFMLLKPQTYMNNSGDAVSKVVNYYNIDIANLVVVHDEVDLPSCSYKLEKGRGAAGHNGVLSVMELLDTKDFWRLRIGVGKPDDPAIGVEKHVLSNMSSDEINFIKHLAETINFSDLT